MKTVRLISCILAGFTVLITLVWITDFVYAQKEMPDLRTYLEKNLRFSKREIGAINTDVVVKQVYTAKKSREIAVAGIVRINIPEEFFVEQFRHIESFMQHDTLHQIGTFSKTPKPEDLVKFQLPPSDIEELAKCNKIGKCKVKLPASAFDRLREIDWSEGNATDRVTDLFRKGYVNYVRTYLENGNSALIVYADKKKPMSLAKGLDTLLAQAFYVYRYIPELHRYLEEFPYSAPPGVYDFLYWSVEDFGQRPTTTITQATIYERKKEANPGVMIALKQIYASHYFQARFQLMALVKASTGPKEPSIYLVYIDRLLFDENLNWVNSKLILKGVMSHVKSWFTSIRNSLQDKYRDKKEMADHPISQRQ